MQHLYIIGNGFDLHHRINSSYRAFYEYLADYHPELLGEINEIFIDCDVEWWSDFENKLGELDIYSVAGEVAYENRPDLLSEHCDRTWNDAEIEVNNKLEVLFNNIIETFHEWILQLNKPVPELSLNIETVNSVFLTFNYTKTLENLYGIDFKQILHIHGCIDDLEIGHSENFILGHGKDRNDIIALNDEEEPNIPDGLSDEELQHCLEEFANRVEFHEQLARDAAVDQLHRLRKPVKEIIANNLDFFQNLDDIDKVHVYGFSFSQIDEPYMAIIADKLKHVEWEISDYKNSNSRKINDFLAKYHIHNSSIISLEDILDKRQLKLDF
ncbi:MAG: bacteriophage abortive infection AbiH family protein [Bacteroidales bacterium]|nr:bacteriophage abortive infection AbiH family protein [Bacteroidales bacterium]